VVCAPSPSVVQCLLTHSAQAIDESTWTSRKSGSEPVPTYIFRTGAAPLFGRARVGSTYRSHIWGRRRSILSWAPSILSLARALGVESAHTRRGSARVSSSGDLRRPDKPSGYPTNGRPSVNAVAFRAKRYYTRLRGPHDPQWRPKDGRTYRMHFYMWGHADADGEATGSRPSRQRSF
jgi:hypothetical protein